MTRALTLAQAERIVEACPAEAVSVGQPMNIALTDADGAVVGGVGVSAGGVEEDHQVAAAGRAAYV